LEKSGVTLFWMTKSRSEDERTKIMKGPKFVSKIVWHFISKPATWQRKACEWLELRRGPNYVFTITFFFYMNRKGGQKPLFTENIFLPVLLTGMFHVNMKTDSLSKTKHG
jgi:hypothetical protein